MKTNHLHYALRTTGYFEIANDRFSKNDYNSLYNSYDDFIDTVMAKENVFTIISQCEKDFLMLDQQGQRYCLGNPPIFSGIRK